MTNDQELTGFHWLERNQRACLSGFFTEHPPSFLIDTVVEGYLGSVVVDNIQKPLIARLEYADVVIFGGDPHHPAAKKLVETTPMEKGILQAPGDWFQVIREILGDELIEILRYRFSEESLELDLLKSITRNLPAKYMLRRINLDLAERIMSDPNQISEDHVRNFDSAEDFVQRGLGYVVLDGEYIVSGASSYAICKRGIEIQVNTNPAYRRQGLAAISSAAFLVECLETGRKPHWDAGNPESAQLARKLGFTPTGTYSMLLRVE
ncbi:MAG TPA: GNAT family N-acetyltransferase [Anaerolineales bacterium]|nr:GNAT family N-acetyltransferase [Anaerolineales bacterium]